MKLHVPPATPVSSNLPVPTDHVMALTPREVLRHAHVPHGGATAARILVQWVSPPDYFVTWEDAFDFHQRFPDAPGWGQAATYGGQAATYGEGNVSNL